LPSSRSSELSIRNDLLQSIIQYANYIRTVELSYLRCTQFKQLSKPKIIINTFLMPTFIAQIEPDVK